MSVSTALRTRDVRPVDGPAAQLAGAAPIIGWDVGGAHLKACLLGGQVLSGQVQGGPVQGSPAQSGQVLDVAEWACPLWQGLDRLDAALDLALARWPGATTAHHAVTMTGEMADFFAHRQDGVQRIAQHMLQRLGPHTHFFAGHAGWCGAADVAAHWQHIASANWWATASHAAQALGDGVLVDVGSTTTDLIAFKNGRVHSRSHSDSQRLASGELVYHGVVRTPLCAVARRIRWRDTAFNVMNEFFATSADVYRLTGELNPAHDLHPSADNGPKDVPGTQQRLARMVGLDARDGSDGDWLAFAHAWRTEQLAELAAQLQRVLTAADLPVQAPLVSAGCGDFLVRPLAAEAGRPCLAYGTHVARMAPGAQPGAAAWAQVCAPSVAAAALLRACIDPNPVALVANLAAAHGTQVSTPCG